jgi:thiamine kinase-like enzyme
MKTLERYGYGSSFNELTVNGDCITKKCKNDYGLVKIEHEINFYKFIHEKDTNFPIVKILQFFEDGYEMKFLIGYKPLYEAAFNIDDVYRALNTLHMCETKEVSKEYFLKQLTMEINDKILDRFNSIRDSVIKYEFVTHVNGIRIMKFEELLEKINKEIYECVNNMEKYEFVPIHGDCQFNNILTNDKDIVFIDPRGYYGESSVFGMKEYDMAKVLFALSGYDEFDSRIVNTLDIRDKNVSIQLNSIVTDIFNRSKLEVLLMLNIWMGNAHSFIDNEYKMLYSYFISLYLGSLYFSKKWN